MTFAEKCEFINLPKCIEEGIGLVEAGYRPWAGLFKAENQVIDLLSQLSAKQLKKPSFGAFWTPGGAW